jgi:tripartite-type tricarboxylate transporter receptor subunit TctC
MMNVVQKNLRPMLSGVLGAFLATAACAQGSVEDFYRGKTVNVVIGYSSGGGYDLYARLLTRHMGKHIPGKPTLVAQNMPGAGSLKAIQYIYGVAPKDGTVFGTFARGMPIYPLLFGGDFDGRKLGYLGSITTDTSVCLSWHTTAVKTWSDVLAKDFKVGGEGKGSDPDLFATLLKTEFNPKVQLISGYPGTADITLAMQRGEVDGLCGISYSTLKSAHSSWVKDKQINILVQAALEKDPALTDVPLLLDEAKETRQHQIVRLAVAPQAMARPFAAPPGLPPERLAALREAFEKTMKDPDFLAEAAKLNMDVNPLKGSEIETIVNELYETPKDVVQAAARAMGGG